MVYLFLGFRVVYVKKVNLDNITSCVCVYGYMILLYLICTV